VPTSDPLDDALSELAQAFSDILFGPNPTLVSPAANSSALAGPPGGNMRAPIFMPSNRPIMEPPPNLAKISVTHMAC
jgi:hypothetical protein